MNAREFLTANDYIHWGYGVADHALYNGSFFNRNIQVIPPSNYSVVDNTAWSAFVDPQPTSVYVYENALDLMVSPWWNLDAPYLDITPQKRQELVGLKESIYPTLIQIDVNNAFYGLEDELIPFDQSNTIPSVYYNFAINPGQVAAFEASLGLPNGYSLAPVKILENDTGSDYYLTLNVYEIDNALEGMRAEWLVYVDRGNGIAHQMIVELMTEDAALNPVSLLHLPGLVEHSQSGSTLTTSLSSTTTQFEASVNFALGSPELQTLDWVESKDFVCYANSVCDKVYYGEGSLESPFIAIDPNLASITTINTPWDSYITGIPSSVLVKTDTQLFIKKPWVNVDPGSSMNPPIDENIPVARAGNDKDSMAGPITLNGSSSYSPMNNIPLTYNWTLLNKPAGSNATITNANQAIATLQADLTGNYTAMLIVTDSLNVDSLPDTITVSVNPQQPSVGCMGGNADARDPTMYLILVAGLLYHFRPRKSVAAAV